MANVPMWEKNILRKVTRSSSAHAVQAGKERSVILMRTIVQKNRVCTVLVQTKAPNSLRVNAQLDMGKKRVQKTSLTIVLSDLVKMVFVLILAMVTLANVFLDGRVATVTPTSMTA
jgi:hypothetical protein